MRLFLVLALAAVLPAPQVVAATTSFVSGSYFHPGVSSEVCNHASYFGNQVECHTQTLFHDPVTGKYFQQTQNSTASASYGALKAKSDLSYSEIDLYTEIYEDGTTHAYSADGEFEYLGEVVPTLAMGGGSGASAWIDDTWRITGGEAGTTGKVRLSYALDGTAYSTSPTLPDGSVLVDIPDNLGIQPFFSSSYAHLSINEMGVVNVLPDGAIVRSIVNQGTYFSIRSNEVIDTVVDLELDFTFGKAFDFRLSFEVGSSFSAPLNSDEYIFGHGPVGAFSTFADFFNTASLTDIRVFDFRGEEILFNLFAESGAQEFLAFSSDLDPEVAPVPLPAALPLLMGAIGTLGLCRRRRDSRIPA